MRFESDTLEGGNVVSASKHGLVVEVDGYELYVSTRVKYSGCGCCGDTAQLQVSYNKQVDGDPLGLNE